MFEEKLFGVPWSLLALAAGVVAAVYLLWDLTAMATGWRWWVLRWAHGACWVLLAAAALARTRLTPLPVDWAGPLAIAGGLTYVGFILTNMSKG
jgi:hypothetical protein